MERSSRFEEWFKLLMLRLHAARTFQERFVLVSAPRSWGSVGSR
ncbi:MAG TPA: hypothetical protein VGG06_36235 [Thermoanaerobaculia bacterium]|jgi:hypothetical protein